MNGTFQDSRREQTSLAAPVERRVLAWLARRMPVWVNSDHLTVLGFLAFGGAGVAYGLTNWSPGWLHAVNACLFLNWFGDSLDGTLARYRNHLRPRYGFYVDHVTDTAGSLMLVLGLAGSPYMSAGIALALLIAFFMLSINTYLATHALGTFRLSFWKFSPTEARLLLATGNLVLLFHPTATLGGRRYLLYDVGGAIAAAGMVMMFVASAISNTARLYRLEPRQGRRV
ncbi:MAG: CDP-alcohol phosphatidyltransferase family protein [Acidobacteriota bacterium]